MFPSTFRCLNCEYWVLKSEEFNWNFETWTELNWDNWIEILAVLNPALRDRLGEIKAWACYMYSLKSPPAIACASYGLYSPPIPCNGFACIVQPSDSLFIATENEGLQCAYIPCGIGGLQITMQRFQIQSVSLYSNISNTCTDGYSYILASIYYLFVNFYHPYVLPRFVYDFYGEIQGQFLSRSYHYSLNLLFIC